jgi:selenocysteine-specific elongation factor
MPVDRAFVRRGFGTVVTGTAWEGTLHDGEEVELAPLGMRARVRGVQVHGESASIASAGSRVALNLAGVTLGDTARGTWVSRVGAALPCPTTLDVAFELLPDAPPLPADARVVVLHGTREVEARIVPLGAWADADTAGVEPLAGEGERTFLQPGTRSYVQLRLDEPLPCKAGDRFVARRASPAATLGGGVILDPWAPVVRRRDAARACALLARLEGGDTEAWLERAGTAGLNAAERRDRGVTGGVLLGDRWRDGELVTAWCTGVRANLGRWHAAHPLALGPNKKALRTGDLTCLDDREVAALVELEVGAGTVVAEGGRVRAHDFAVRLTTAQAAWCARALALVRAAGLAGVEELAGQSLDPANTFPVLGTEGGQPASNAEATALAYLLRDRGELVEIAGGGHPPRLYAPDVLEKLVADVRAWFTTQTELDPGAFKELTWQSRRTAIPLLEWLDARGVTRRRGDVRIVGA